MSLPETLLAPLRSLRQPVLEVPDAGFQSRKARVVLTVDRPVHSGRTKDESLRFGGTEERWSSGATSVVVMEAADREDLNDRAAAGRLTERSRHGRG